jgi:hypothetical protein
MKIYIKNLSGRSTQITVNESDTISKGKQIYQSASNSSNADPQWKFDGIVLNNNKTFKDYGIEEDDNITSNDRSQGGAIKLYKII